MWPVKVHGVVDGVESEAVRATGIVTYLLMLMTIENPRLEKKRVGRTKVGLMVA